MKPINLSIALVITMCMFASISFGQSSGYINRPATIPAGRTVLDPDLNGYTSINTSGFGTDDIANSEIPYKVVRSYSIEPYGDLRRGPDHNFSDFVPDAGDNGFYFYFTGTQLLYRQRLGSIMPGSKGYSVLLDTDGKFGASGANADPNYIPATTGTNGNPGFEIEIVLETNFRIAIYNVDGTSSPVLIKSYTNWQEMSQVSITATNDNGDPDFFMDFYIPFSDLQAAPFNLTASSPLRMISTTVMSPQAAIGGPKSDIYGLSDDLYSNTNSQYEDFINGQPTFTLGGTGIAAMCTNAPNVNSPILTGVVNISGSWTKSNLVGALSAATITVYKNGSSVGTVTSVASGSTWTLNNIGISGNDTITAKAQASGESMCLLSNAVIARACNTSNTSSTSGAAFVCSNSRRGFSGTRVANASVKIYSLAGGGNPVLFATDGTPVSPSGYNITYSDATHWEYNGSNNSGTVDPCSGGPNDIPNGSYFFTNTESGKCESAPVWGGCVNLTATNIPTVTQANLYNGSNTVSGTADVGATVRLYQNGVLIASTTAAGGVYSFTNKTFELNDLVEVNAQVTGNCLSSAVSRTVNCFTNPPLITADGNSQILAGAYITGTSSEAAGATIKVYTSGAVLVATTSVQPDGTWSTGNAGTTPAVYTAVASTSYYANAKNGTCTVSANSATYAAVSGTSVARCGTITGPVSSAATTISGTLTGSFTTTTVNLYLDGTLIGTTTTTTTSWGPISVNTIPANTLYSNGTLRIGIQESGKQEVECTGSELKITCPSAPGAPVVTPPSSTISLNQAVTYTISNAVSGNFYAVSDSATGLSLGQGIWASANGNLNLTTNTFSNAGSYKIEIKATALSGLTICTSPAARAAVDVSVILPVTLTQFTGKRNAGEILLEWKTQNEFLLKHFEIQKSADGKSFETISNKESTGLSSNTYYFKDVQVSSDVVYYRLKIVNSNGAISYSNILVFVNNGAGIIKASVLPNPFKDKFAVNVLLEKAEDISVYILDASGRVITNKNVKGNSGPNSIQLNNLGQLSGGIYFVKIKTSSSVYQQKVLKVN